MGKPPSGSALESLDDVALNIDARGHLDKEVCQNEVVARKDLASIESVVIQEPPTEEQCGPLVAFGEALSSCDSIRHGPRSDNWILLVVN